MADKSLQLIASGSKLRSHCQSPKRSRELAVQRIPGGIRLIKTFIDMLMKE
jgi:hypothetical protein